MAFPINSDDFVHQRKVERTQIEYQSDWKPKIMIQEKILFIT